MSTTGFSPLRQPGLTLPKPPSLGDKPPIDIMPKLPKPPEDLFAGQDLLGKEILNKILKGREEPLKPIVGTTATLPDGSALHTNPQADGTQASARTYVKDGKTYMENESGTYELIDTPSSDGNGFTREYVNQATGERRSEKWTRMSPDGAMYDVDTNGDGKTDLRLLNRTTLENTIAAMREKLPL